MDIATLVFLKRFIKDGGLLEKELFFKTYQQRKGRIHQFNCNSQK